MNRQKLEVVPEILVEFVPDFSKLESGVDTLVKNGTITKEMAGLFTEAGKSIDAFAARFGKLSEPIQKALAPAIAQAKKNIKDLSTSGIKDLGELKKRVDGITNSFADGFGEGVKQALDEAGISMDEFTAALKAAEGTQKTLKQELREINEQLAQMKLRGEENTTQYQELRARAGEYRDTLKDVAEEINRSASDTRKLDTAIEFVTGLSASFAVLQGIQALAGDQSEEFQKTLLKVNAAMSILIGLQQVANLLQKESNLIRGIANVQKRLEVTLTTLETAAQSKNIIVKGAATVATKALNAAMSANPALILVTAFTALAGAIAFFTGKSKESKDIVEDFNNELERTNQILDRQVEKIDEETQRQITLAKLRGATEEEITQITLDGVAKRSDAQQGEFDRRIEGFKKTLKDISTLASGADISFLTAQDLGLPVQEFNRLAREGVSTVDEALDLLNKVKAVRTVDAWKGFSDEAKKNNELVANILESIITPGKAVEAAGKTADELRAEQAQKQRDADKKNLEDRKRAAEQQRQKEAEILQRGFEDFVAKQKLRLLTVEKGSEEELTVRRDIARAELQLALNNEKLTFNQRKLLIQSFFSEQRELNEQFRKENQKRSIEDSITQINTELSAIKLSFSQREELTIELLNKQRDLELSQVVNNKTKEKEINARFDKEIVETKRKIRQDAFNEEITDIQRENFIRIQTLQNVIASPDSTSSQQRAAIDELFLYEMDLIVRRRRFNQEQLKAGLIDIEQYNRNAKDIANDEFTFKTNLEKQYTDIAKEETEKRKQIFQEYLQTILDTANLIVESLRNIFETIAANEDDRVAQQRENLERLRENNAITQKEFEAKTKVVDRLERDANRKQAEREKTLALFEAFINGGAAIIKAAPNPFLIAATAALVITQINAIASRPIPRFGAGTKSAPKGLAEVGETGTEIIRTEKGYYVAEHPQLIWFKGGERVYNPKETSEMIQVVPQANTNIMNSSVSTSIEKDIDYNKMAEKIGSEIAKHPRNIITLDEHGFNIHMREKDNVQRYLNKRYTFND